MQRVREENSKAVRALKILKKKHFIFLMFHVSTPKTLVGEKLEKQTDPDHSMEFILPVIGLNVKLYTGKIHNQIAF